MKAFYTKASMRFELREVKIGPLASDEVLVQVKACGVCGWDVLVAESSRRKSAIELDWRGY